MRYQFMPLALVTALVSAWSGCGQEPFALGEETTDAGLELGAEGSLDGLSLTSPTCGAGSGGDLECRACTDQSCASAMSACFGVDYTTTLAGGVCLELGTCVAGCTCGDSDCFKVCLTQHASEGSPCRTCLYRVAECQHANCAFPCVESPDAGADPDDAGGDPRRDAGKPE